MISDYNPVMVPLVVRWAHRQAQAGFSTLDLVVAHHDFKKEL